MYCISVLCNIYEQVSFFPIQICLYREAINLVHIKKQKGKILYKWSLVLISHQNSFYVDLLQLWQLQILIFFV